MKCSLCGEKFNDDKTPKIKGNGSIICAICTIYIIEILTEKVGFSSENKGEINTMFVYESKGKARDLP